LSKKWPRLLIHCHVVILSPVGGIDQCFEPHNDTGMPCVATVQTSTCPWSVAAYVASKVNTTPMRWDRVLIRTPSHGVTLAHSAACRVSALHVIVAPARPGGQETTPSAAERLAVDGATAGRAGVLLADARTIASPAIGWPFVSMGPAEREPPWCVSLRPHLTAVGRSLCTIMEHDCPLGLWEAHRTRITMDIQNSTS
jgi:hypothetical protein